jgi:parallel beta-helix repeat protein
MQIPVNNRESGSTLHSFVIILVFLISVVASAAEVFAIDLLVPDEFFTIDEAMNFAEPGDTVIVKPGTYNERIKIKEGVSLVSFAGPDGNDLVDGPGKKKVLRRTLRTIIDGSGITAPGYLISFPTETTAAMALDGFTVINMPKYISGLNLFLVQIRGCSPKVENNIFANNKSWGGVLSTGLGIGMGPALETVARPVIRNNVVYGNSGPGIANGANSAALISNNEIFGNLFPDAAIRKRNAPCIGMREYARPIIENNECYNNGDGIGGINLSSHEDTIIIRNNIVYNNKHGGIGMRALGGADTDVKILIKNNTISGNAEGGIRLLKLDNGTIVDNHIFDNKKPGITCYHVDNLVIERNEIHGNLAAGIRLLDVYSASVRHNRLYRNVTAGIDFIGWEK